MLLLTEDQERIQKFPNGGGGRGEGGGDVMRHKPKTDP